MTDHLSPPIRYCDTCMGGLEWLLAADIQKGNYTKVLRMTNDPYLLNSSTLDHPSYLCFIKEHIYLLWALLLLEALSSLTDSQEILPLPNKPRYLYPPRAHVINIQLIEFSQTKYSHETNTDIKIQLH